MAGTAGVASAFAGEVRVGSSHLDAFPEAAAATVAAAKMKERMFV